MRNCFCFRSPECYHGLTLPRKLPPRSTPLAIHNLPMLGFLEQTVSMAITKALSAVGCFKPKYPFLSAQRSALLYVAYHLKGLLLYFMIYFACSSVYVTVKAVGMINIDQR